jgi:DNA-binding NarL/FixJ family response regulator
MTPQSPQSPPPSAAHLRVLIADDDATVRNDLRRILELEHDIEVVATCHDGQHAVDQCTHLWPDVAVLDVRMPVLDGIGATRLIRQMQQPGATPPAVLIITTFDLDEYVLGALRAGAAGFLLKDQTPEELADAVRTVARGDGVLAPRATARLIEEFTQPVAVRGPADLLGQHGLPGLTAREREVLEFIAQGKSNDEIADILVVSLATVKTHVSNMLAKLHLENRVQAVVWAYENNVAPVRNPTTERS